MKTYTTFNTRKTPQSEAVPGSNQIQNNAGGFAWQVDKWIQLERFLVLGSEGGTYYVKERELTKDNANSVLQCIKEDGIKTVNKIVEISEQGRAPKNDPALFALAMAAGLGDKQTKIAALGALSRVARIGTHLFHFLTYVQQFRGWGRLLRDGVSNWYTDKTPEKLAYQIIKYQQRDGWSHRDALRKCHPIAPSEAHNDIFKYITKQELRSSLQDSIIDAFEKAKHTTDLKTLVKLITDYNLPREAIPTEALNNPIVWEALLENMPMTAMIRNLGKMTSVDLLKPMGTATNKVVNRLLDESLLKKAKIHPLSLLVALNTYFMGQGVRGSLSWSPIREIVDALDESFYLSFGAVEPTNKRTMLALDVSGSMTFSTIAGMTGITPRVGSAAMALITANIEKQYMFMGFSDRFIPLNISNRQRMDDVLKTVNKLSFSSTDCALPMIYALERDIEIDTFVIYTDSETWYGNIHPSQALEKYRQKIGIPAKLVVVGMVSNNFTIADPNDSGMLDVVGFDTATPNVISNFSKH
ncbi:MAG: TROVE domain-containing protein [Candidatus Heimdallarchaeaceae archaeon]